MRLQGILRALMPPPDISALQDAGDIEGLIGLLSHPDFDVQWRAAEALGIIGSPALDRLLDRLLHSDPKVRLGVIEALGDIRDPRAVDPLSTVVEEDASIEVRWATTHALGNIGDARAIPPLVATLGDPDKYVRFGASVSLERLGWVPPGDHERALLLIARQDWPALQSLGLPAVRPLEGFIQDGDPAVREAVVDLLGSIGDPRAEDLCIVALRDPESEVRWKATLASSRCGIPAMRLPISLARRTRSGKNPAAAALLNLFFVGMGYDYLGRWYGISLFQLNLMMVTLSSLVLGPLLPFLASYSVSSLIAAHTWISLNRTEEVKVR